MEAGVRGTLLSESDDCGRRLLRLLSRGHAIAAELQRAAEALPPSLLGQGPDFARLAPVLRDFAVFRSAGAIDRVATSPELIQLDEESRELHFEAAKRLFRLLAAIRKYASDLRKFLDDLEAGVFVNHNLEEVICDADGAQLLPEAVAMLGALLLLLDERVNGPVRERALVLFYRCTVGTNEEAEEFSDICRLFSASGRPGEVEMTTRGLGYPEAFFARFPLPKEAVRMAVGQLQAGDVYGAARHYPLPQHRSLSLASQAGLLFLLLFFNGAQQLQSDVAAMREIVNRHFSEAWVVAYALGFTADLLAMWAPYPAARQALTAAITQASVRQLREQHTERLAATRQQLADYLKEGVLTQDLVSKKTPQILSCLRQANTSIRWLLLQPTTSDAKLQAVLKDLGSSVSFKEQLLEALLDTALLEEKVRSLLGPLVARREADWQELKAAASQAMDDLAVYFSGDHALRRKVKNKELEEWFRGLQERIEALSYGGTQEETLVLSRKVSQLCRALEEVESFYEISQQPQILHFLADAREGLQQMVRTVSLSEETFETMATVADLSFAWKALGAYQQTMQGLLAKSAGSVKGLRALFLKLASILNTPLRRIRQAGNSAHEELVSGYYSQRLEDFMRAVLQEIPRVIFRLLQEISELTAARPPEPLPSRWPLEEVWAYAQRSEAARDEVMLRTQRIARLVRGMREADVAVLGVIRVEPCAVLAEGLRRELAGRIATLLAGLSFPQRTLSRKDVAGPLESLAVRADALRKAFENVQDYLGVSALKLWHQELGRSIRFLLHMELHALLRQRLPPASRNPYNDADVPIAFPDALGSRGSGSFISRTATALIVLSDPKAAVGGLQGEWRSTSGELLIDGLLLDTLQRALGPCGVAALSRFLGVLAACKAKEALGAAVALEASSRGQLYQIQQPQSAREPPRTLRTAAQRTSTAARPLLEALTSLGQQQLLRRCLHFVQRLHAQLNAPLMALALQAMDTATLSDAVEASGLEDVWDFVGDGTALAFQQRVAAAAELAGFSDPLRQLYMSVPVETVPPNLGESLGLALMTSLAARPEVKGLLKSMLKGSSPEVDSQEAGAALTAGLATLLQQLPRGTCDAMLGQLCGYLASLCAEAAEAKDAGRECWAEGNKLLDVLWDLLALLGLPREHLGRFVPWGMLELWPMEQAA